MSSLGAHDRKRAGRSRWFDPRLAIGVVLVAASVAGVVAIVSAADRTVTVYAARSMLAIGDVVTAEELIETQVRLGTATEHYLSPGRVPSEGVIVTRVVGSGELVPADAVGDALSEDWASLVIPIAGELPRSLGEGTVVDVWAARESVDEEEAPGIIASKVTVVAVTDNEGMIAGEPVLGVELVVPRDSVARILQSRAAGDTLSLVPSAVALGS
ncbi:hypothetical protein OH146_04240 [Salinibacterium sp. SYSU T00001]|uniref:hypothetical protein n=1 Tax=Homoserinimonas sedimenticola TaxID=2986805 RepID=UPI002235F099|nr:hypothetical protein [Salinibacterium sedimenticola]MCW4384979.1 hypothetical protein [Salinibacterium sedimenticola]